MDVIVISRCVNGSRTHFHSELNAGGAEKLQKEAREGNKRRE